MTEIETMLALLKASRQRTLDTLQKIEAEPDPGAVLRWRPGPGRANVAWQLMHAGATEELFATERLIPGSKAAFGDLIPRYQGGSTPDDNVPPPAQIRQFLGDTRAHLEATLRRYRDDQLDQIPEPIAERGWTMRTVLQVLAWHEAHHQGQAHLTYNLWKARTA